MDDGSGTPVLQLDRHGGSAEDEVHPRLMADWPRLDAIRAILKEKGSDQQQVYEVVKARIEESYKDIYTAYGDGGPMPGYDYAFGHRGRETAFLSLLAMTPDEKAKCAELAYKAAMETRLQRRDETVGGQTIAFDGKKTVLAK